MPKKLQFRDIREKQKQKRHPTTHRHRHTQN